MPSLAASANSIKRDFKFEAGSPESNLFTGLFCSEYGTLNYYLTRQSVNNKRVF